jgi:hypothetical protein
MAKTITIKNVDLMTKEQEDDLRKFLDKSNIAFQVSKETYSAEDLKIDCDWLSNGELKTASECKPFILYIVKKSGGKVKWKK